MSDLPLDTGRQARAFVADFFQSSGPRAFWALGLVLAAGVLEGVGLTLLIPFLQIANLGEGDGGSVQALAAQAFAVLGIQDGILRMGTLVAAFAVLMVVRTILNSRRELVVAQLQIDYLIGKQIRLVLVLSHAPWIHVARLRHSRINHLLSSDVYRLGEAATGLVLSTVALVMLCVQTAIALFISPTLTVIAVVALAGAGVVAWPLLRAARSVGEAQTASHLALLDNTSQFLGALKLAVSQNLQFQFESGFRSGLSSLSDSELDYVRRHNRVRMRLTIIGILVGSAVAVVGFGVLTLPVASVLVVMLIFGRMAGPINTLQAQALELVRALPAFRQIRALEADLGSDSPAADVQQDPGQGDIRFEHVVYQHPTAGDQAAEARVGAAGVHGLDLTIRAGSLIGIAGPSGAGKTTFADLLVGLYRPQSGRITVGDGPGLDLPAARVWRDRLSYVSQDPFLRNDTVRANLLWARPEATEQELSDALTTAGADVVVARLPDGLDTVVGERGGLISGGERQRLAIARALLRQPGLLILDEATNAIDVAGERALLARLAALRPALTVVMIAHRLESLSLCDEVIIIDGGKVVAQDSFMSLRDYLSDPSVRARLDPAAA